MFEEELIFHNSFRIRRDQKDVKSEGDYESDLVFWKENHGTRNFSRKTSRRATTSGNL